MAKRRTTKKQSAKKQDRAHQQRVGVLYALTAIFTVAVGGLIVARPAPLASQSDGTDLPVRPTVLAAVSADPIDALLAARVPVQPGVWRRLTLVRVAPDTSVPSGSAHFTIDRSAREGVRVGVGESWLEQRPARGAAGDDLRLIIRDDPTGGPMAAPSQDPAIRQFVVRLARLTGVDATPFGGR